MAPEYLVRGQLTEKVDVYSFGVFLIELFCGKRSNPMSQDPLSILQMVWNYYNSNRLPEAVDPILSGQFQAEVATRVLQIGLLCTQASAELRPSMSVVAKMLTDGGLVPPPSQPPFLNSDAEIPFGRSNSRHGSSSISSGNSMSVSLIEPR
ncbi:Cysteine-rich receptor-like protein kinase 3 [Acorus gramineus]|uniref:Cysteine-rich receptor-like protein kinase 3 n=1 Tax=Acorus gramineus TaxID=55184 RepID=A0AAV9AY88_ACOGR|nr:Cysteine-rich receptor-like protein kinase 3 [Acorus gramineus]